MTGEQSTVSAAILVSGDGTNLQAFIDEVQAGNLNLDLAVVASNNPKAFALERAKRAGIPVTCVPHTDFPQRAQFDGALADALEHYRPDLLILAGFMRILTPSFIRRFEGRILNIHPSLLPRFSGLDTHQRALQAGDLVHGSTVHFVTEELDAGPAIVQGRVPVLPGDTAATLAERVQSMEHRIYPAAVALVAAGRVLYHEGAARFDGRLLEQPLQFPQAFGSVTPR
ncbi:MAG: phosphoribosylglycinamide formyltransferase [Woeseia sp.]